MPMTKDDLRTLSRIYTEKNQDKEARLLAPWKDIAALTNPQMSDWNYEPTVATAATGQAIYDSSGLNASNKYADGMMGTALGRNVRFFAYAPEDIKFTDNDEIGRFLEEASKVRYRQFTRSNFYDEARTFLKCFADFSTAAMIVETDAEKGVQVYNVLHPKRYVILEDSRHLVDSIFYDFWINAFEAVARFCPSKDDLSALPDQIQIAYKTKRSQLFKFTTYIFPTNKFGFESDMQRLAKGKPYATVTVADIDREKIVAEGGYDRKRFFVARWSPSMDGTEFGIGGPGLTALGDMKQANALRRAYTRAAAKRGEPPIKATENLRGQINLTPNGVTYLHTGEDMAYMQAAGELQSQLLDLQDLRKSIESAYYVDFFLVLTQNIDRKKTATEVQGLLGEKAALMSAFYGRLVYEFLEPIIEDGFADDLDLGLLPDIPRAVQGRDLKIDMVSPLAMLQKQAVIIAPLTQFIRECAAMAQVDPKALDSLDIDAYLSELADSLGVSKKVVRNQYQILKMRDARAQLAAQQQAAEMQNAQQQTQADVFSKMAKAPEPGSPAAQASVGRGMPA